MNGAEESILFAILAIYEMLKPVVYKEAYMASTTVLVTLSDVNQQSRAKRTILDSRTRGEWKGDIVWITVGFDPSPVFTEFHRVRTYRVEHLDTRPLLDYYQQHPLRPTCDDRETKKLTQWDKFYVFDSWFLQWERVIYMDAGLRIVDRLAHLLELDCTGVLLAPDDAAPYDTEKRFDGIIEADAGRHPEVVESLLKEYPPEILKERYFLNCIWMYDTALLHRIHLTDLIDAMHRYPICRCNEMTIMNLLFTFKHRVWRPFPEHCPREDRRRLFGWTERDRDYGPYTTWRDFCFLKYPITLSMEDCT